MRCRPAQSCFHRLLSSRWQWFSRIRILLMNFSFILDLSFPTQRKSCHLRERRTLALWPDHVGLCCVSFLRSLINILSLVTRFWIKLVQECKHFPFPPCVNAVRGCSRLPFMFQKNLRNVVIHWFQWSLSTSHHRWKRD